MKKTISILMCFLLTFTLFSVPIKADEDIVKIEAYEDGIEISNGFISRHLKIDDGHIKTDLITNKLTGMVIQGDEESQDFAIGLLEKEIETGKYTATGWNATLKGKTGEFNSSQVKTLFDDNLNTYIDAPSQAKGNPFVLTIDFGKVLDIKAFSVNKRPGVTKEYAAQYPHGGKRGVMGAYEIKISEDGIDFESVKEGEFTQDVWNLHSEGNMTNIGDTAYVNFDEMQHARYIQIIQKSVAFEEDYEEFTSSEVDFYSVDYEQYLENIKPQPKPEILSSDLLYKDHEVTNIENGKMLSINYQSYQFNGATYEIRQNFMLENDKGYMRSNIEISTSDPEQTRIDYIDVDRYSIDENDPSIWSKPDDSQITSAYLDKHALMLGQPIYLYSFYAGSEFPAAETDIIDGKTQIRYYSGKNFETLKEQGYLNEEGRFVSWNAVIGSATGSEQNVVQTAFFEYIFDIAVKSDFRIQYNSWYDSGKNINDSVLEELFTQTEDNLSKQGVRPIDSYVSDDGWAVINSSDSRIGFWESNDKFQNEFYPMASLSNKLSSSFGIWLSPHGGFGGSDPQTRSDMLEEWGTGYAQRATKLWDHVICTGSEKYIQNFTALVRDYEERFGINYWKFDGFAMDACVDSSHDHITGGPNDMYYITEKWERWTDAFNSMREIEPNLWISGTNHVNLSPWLLQWINSIWVQDSGDRGTAGDSAANSLQRNIYYRDDVYSSLIYQKQVQFPLSNIYNHDPIYTKSDNASTDIFREFMIVNAMRGTAFWELYFSPSNMDEEKWMVTADILDFAEKNHDILKNAKMFKEDGKNPSQGVYGYSAWTKDKGIVSFTNPTNTEKTYDLQLTNIIGVKEGMQSFKQTQIFPYTTDTGSEKVNYGDTISVTLAPFSTRVYEFGITDHEAPSVISFKKVDEETLKIKFDERINIDSLIVEINGELIDQMEIEADYRTVKMSYDQMDEAELAVVSVKDTYGNELEKRNEQIQPENYLEDINFEGMTKYTFGDQTFALFDGKAHASGKAVDVNKEYEISFAFVCDGTDKEIMNQKEGFRIFVDDEGYLVYETKDGQLTTKEQQISVVEKAHGAFGSEEYVPTTTKTEVIGKVNDGNIHAVTINKEPNGLTKLYLDTRLCASMETSQDKEINELYIGSNEFDGMISALEIRTSTKNLQEIDAFASAHMISNDGRVSREKWEVEVCSEAGEGPKDRVIDGDLNTYWHSAYSSGQPTCCDHGNERHTLTLRFGEETAFDYLRYTARVATEKENGLWLTADVYGITQDGTEELLVKDQVIEVDANRNFDFTFEETQYYYGVTFKIEGKNGFGVCAEINAYENLDKYTTVSDAVKLIIKANDIESEVNGEYYEEDSYLAMKTIIDDIKSLDPFKTRMDDFDQLNDSLDQAYRSLVLKKADYSKVDEAIANADQLEKETYTSASWNVLQETIKEVIRDLDITRQQEVDMMAQTIEEAITKLIRLGDKSQLQIIYAAWSDLDLSGFTSDSAKIFEDALANAETVLNDSQATQPVIDDALVLLIQAQAGLMPIETDNQSLEEMIQKAEGLDTSLYTKESVDNLKKAIEAAKAVFLDPKADQEDVQQALNDLQNAVANLEKAEIEEDHEETKDPSTAVKRSGQHSCIIVIGSMAVLLGLLAIQKRKWDHRTSNSK